MVFEIFEDRPIGFYTVYTKHAEKDRTRQKNEIPKLKPFTILADSIGSHCCNVLGVRSTASRLAFILAHEKLSLLSAVLDYSQTE